MPKQKTQTKFYIYKDVNGEFRWHAKRRGKIVAESGEGYKRKKALMKTLLAFTDSMVHNFAIMEVGGTTVETVFPSIGIKTVSPCTGRHATGPATGSETPVAKV